MFIFVNFNLLAFSQLMLMLMLMWITISADATATPFSTSTENNAYIAQICNLSNDQTSSSSSSSFSSSSSGRPQIVGVCQLELEDGESHNPDSGIRLWLVVHFADTPTQYIVFELDQTAIFDTVLDIAKAKRIAPLQTIWNVSHEIAPNGPRRISRIYSLYRPQYELEDGEQQSSSKQEEINHHHHHHHHHRGGGIVFVYANKDGDDKANSNQLSSSSVMEIYDLATDRMYPLRLEMPPMIGSKSTFRISDALLLVPQTGQGVMIFADGAEYRYQPIQMFRSSLFARSSIPSSSSSAIYQMAAGPTLNELSLDRGKDQTLVLSLDGGKFARIISASPETAEFQAIRSKSLHGYIGSGGYDDDDQDLLQNQLLHLFADDGVYVFAKPDTPIISTIGGDDTEIRLQRMLKLNYEDYFVCGKRNNATVWDRLFRLMLFYVGDAASQPQNDQQNANLRANIIFALFGLHLLVALILIGALIVLHIKNTTTNNNNDNDKIRQSNKKIGSRKRLLRRSSTSNATISSSSSSSRKLF